MFRKKAVVPKPPEPPKWEEIHEDIRSAAGNDAVFMLLPSDATTEIPDGDIANEVDSEGYGDTDPEYKNDIDCPLNPEEVYSKVRTLIDNHSQIKHVLPVTEASCGRLVEASQQLKDQVGAVKKTLNVEMS